MKGLDFPCTGAEDLIKLEYEIPKPECSQSPACPEALQAELSLNYSGQL